MKVVGIVQARVGSTRLPNKVMMKIEGKTLIEHLVERLKESRNLDEIIIATTVKSEDNLIVDLCNEKGISVFRGSENDVLNRYYEAAKAYEADIIVRITSDCPLICPVLIDRNIMLFKNNNYDCVSPRSKDGLIRGLDNEIFSFETLEKLNRIVKDKTEREHVTLHMYNNEGIYRIYSPDVENYYKKEYRLCVDEVKDFELIKVIYESLYKEGTIIDFREVDEFLMANPQLVKINEQVIQKNV